MAADDAELIAAAQAGDRSALDQLLRHHVDRIYAVCRRLAGNDADAADAAQEALLAVVRGLPRFDGRAAFGTWVYRVATNACLDELRRRGRRPDPTDPSDLAAGPDTGVYDRGEEANGVVERLHIDQALALLPPEFREPVVLRDLLGFDYADIAEVLDIPPGTVRSRISRGRATLARLLGGNQDPAAGRTTTQP